MKIMTEETFGPVAPVAGFTDIEEVVKLANDTPYGLVAYVQTSNLSKGIKVAEQLEYGTVLITNVDVGVCKHPYGGWKESGIGVSLSEETLYEYMNVKHIKFNL
jgi:acyl-CoA reductase-like NAD-dependent aldehyde dehydrogenase